MKRNSFELEECAANIQSVIAADKGGADRVELCDNLMEGGTTPSLGTISLAKQVSAVDVFPMIRPRGGNFVYDDMEQEIMLRDIKLAVENGADGIVIGALSVDGTVDYDLCCRLIEAARGLPITFHRAFDQCKNPFVALERLMSMGVTRLLTSGHKNKAIDGVSLISQLQETAGNRLKVMPGSGIDETNIAKLVQKTGTKAFHASLRDIYMQEPVYIRSEVKFNGYKDLPENQVKTSSVKRIKNIIKEIERV